MFGGIKVGSSLLPLIQDLLKNGIEPIATLYHWDLPQSLEDKGGWLNRQTVDAFKDYAQLCFSRLGRYIKTWCSINEPWTQCIVGYCFGSHAPGRSIAPGEECVRKNHGSLFWTNFAINNIGVI